MASLRKHEGYLIIDNRCAGEGMGEWPTITCSHCHRVVVLNPGRTRDRAYCSGCDHYICDGCDAIRPLQPACKPFNAVLDQQQAEAFREEHARRGEVLVTLT